MKRRPICVTPHDILTGDCRRAMAGLEPGSFRACVSDSPYNLGVRYGPHYRDDLPDDEYLGMLAEAYAAVHRLLTPDGAVFAFSAVRYQARITLLLERLGFRHLDTIIWHYTFGQSQKTRLTPSYVPIIWAAKGRQVLFNPAAVRVPSARQLKYGDRRANPCGKVANNVWVLDPAVYPGDLFREDGNVWYVPRVAGTFKERVAGHPTQLPLALVERIIGMSTDPGDAVLDPFAGTGTTLVGAARLGRRGVGIELSPDTAAAAAARLEAEMSVKS